ncbi:hypothetical protein A4U53_030680 [Rhizobium ruizarguesonis]|uniref:Uncharacterized protein n=1 Tax=Rhizobium ruizarguesonis TaxID=2081791 RepID=A0ACD5EMP8_9HYPH
MTSILTRDLLMNMLLGLVALVILVLAQVNPAAQADPMQQPGNLVASITWPAGPDDVDLWVSYADEYAVGYSNRSTKIWSLLRDDLGNKNDTTALNFEIRLHTRPARRRVCSKCALLCLHCCSGSGLSGYKARRWRHCVARSG